MLAPSVDLALHSYGNQSNNWFYKISYELSINIKIRLLQRSSDWCTKDSSMQFTKRPKFFDASCYKSHNTNFEATPLSSYTAHDYKILTHVQRLHGESPICSERLLTQHFLNSYFKKKQFKISYLYFIRNGFTTFCEYFQRNHLSMMDHRFRTFYMFENKFLHEEIDFGEKFQKFSITIVLS